MLIPHHPTLSQPPLNNGKSYLSEANVVRPLPEALTAKVDAVLADETGRVSASAAVSKSNGQQKSFSCVVPISSYALSVPPCSSVVPNFVLECI